MCVYSSLAAQSAWRDMTGRRRRVRGWSCSGYLRIFRREALIFLPRSHSLGLGLSHLQCKAERMRRGGDGREGEEEWESTALTLTLSLFLSLAHPPHTDITEADSTHGLRVPAEETRALNRGGRRGPRLPLLQPPSVRNWRHRRKAAGLHGHHHG